MMNTSCTAGWEQESDLTKGIIWAQGINWAQESIWAQGHTSTRAQESDRAQESIWAQESTAGCRGPTTGTSAGCRGPATGTSAGCQGASIWAHKLARCAGKRPPSPRWCHTHSPQLTKLKLQRSQMMLAYGWVESSFSRSFHVLMTWLSGFAELSISTCH
jgi:hypothetical protein